MRELPSHPSLEHLKNQARELLRAHQSGDGPACEALAFLPRFVDRDAGEILDARITLAEAKEAISLQHGFHSWEALRAFVLSLRQDRRSARPAVPDRLLAAWQRAIDSIARLVRVPAALVMRIMDEDIEVFLGSRCEGNPYRHGDREHLIGSGLYCETVINTRQQLLVPDALADPEWESNPDVKLDMISYFGLPLLFPNGEAFGTICVLDRKPNSYSVQVSELLAGGKALIEGHLELLEFNRRLILKNRQLRDSLEELVRLRNILPVCSFCRRARSQDGTWHSIDQYYDKAGPQVSHGICPDCFDTHYEARPDEA